MGWKDKLDQNAQDKIEEHWPNVQRIFQEKIGPAALSAANNDDSMRSLFKFAYEAIPFPGRLVIKEEAFIKFCFSHRDNLLPARGAAGTDGVAG
jgi:hypothetical protein